MSTCTPQQNTVKALISPRGVDWMNFTAESSGFLPMCLTFAEEGDYLFGPQSLHPIRGIIFDIYELQFINKRFVNAEKKRGK